ncbi:TlpA family protein disulfide reductase [Aestuariivivens sediminicola]|uniref:TlpA family protein disulfide reductase n=1 Tax=Aestuariivivens sediminicola TaxID=2913560 RepID=UPI001F5ABEFE|nr:TlpA disulfide reductase family protein [Aestuariivivens sediminicola]
MRSSVFLAFLLVLSACNTGKHKETASDATIAVQQEASSEVNDVDLEIYDYDGFEAFLNKKDNKVHVVNFWATWCAPCVKELPYFEQLNASYADENVEVLLVSLDFPHLYESKLKPFILKNKLASKVIVLDDPDMNRWIPKVDSLWSGSIPATVIYNKHERKFFEQSFTYSELENELKSFLN